MTQAANVLFIHAQTPIHPGSGTALGAVDLPVQRERHTQWPVIPGTSLKGVIRDACRPADGQSDSSWLAVFGPTTESAAEHAGAFSVTDARILAFPVRSLSGVFAWVTCPAVLQRLRRDLQIAQIKSMPELTELPGPQQVLCDKESSLLLKDETVVLEEFDFARSSKDNNFQDLAKWLAESVTEDEYTQKRLKTHLAILSDNDFTHFVRHASEVSARIGLDYESKTVKQGALFYQEFLPAETLFYSLQMASPSRRPSEKLNAICVLNWVETQLKQFHNILQLGGDETTGKGLCLLKILKPCQQGEENESNCAS